jgi:putative oxidoreductase
MNSEHWTHQLALLILRVASGGLMLVSHGLGKAEKLLGGGPIRFADPYGLGEEVSLALAAGAETVCAALLVLGLFTRLSALPLIVTMVTAAFITHGADPLSDREPALMFLAAYSALFLLGGGSWSLQTLFARFIPGNRFFRFLLS